MDAKLTHFLRRDRPFVLPLVLAGAGFVWGLLLGRLSLLNAFLLVILTLSTLGSLLEPLVGVGVALFLGPMWAWLRAELLQVPPLIGQYVFLIAVAAWIGRGLVRRDLHVPFPPLLLPLLAFMGVALFSLWRPADTWIGLWEWAKWGQILLMFLLVFDRLQGAGGRTRAIVMGSTLVGAGVFQALVGLWQFALRGTGPDHFAIDERFYRAYGTFEQPNPFAGFLGMMGAIVAGMVLRWGWDWVATYGSWLVGWGLRGVGLKSEIQSPKPRRKYSVSRIPCSVSRGTQFVFVITATAVICAGIAASWSRGAWMGFGAALLTVAAALPRRGMWGILLVALLVVGGLGLYSAGLLPSAVASRLTGFLAYTRFEDVRGAGINDANFAVLERMAHWQAALDMWRANFWLGVGFGCYEPAYPTYRLINWPYALGHAHNYYLNLLAETGVLGLAAYLVFLGNIFLGLWRVSRRSVGWMRGIALGLIGAWTHLLVHNFVDNILVNNVHLHLGVMLALSAWLVHNNEAGTRDIFSVSSLTRNRKDA